MNKELKILIVEDECEACKELLEYIDQKEDVVAVGVTNNAAKALDYIREYIPDAIILDLELHNGSGNGLSLLQEMRYFSIAKRPYVLITTNNSSVRTHEYARELGADFIMYKHQENYSAKEVIDLLIAMRGFIQNKMNVMKPQDNATIYDESPGIRKQRIIKRIHSHLDLVSISPKAVGYDYLTDAIFIAMEGKTKGILSEIAKKYDKTESSVERAVENAIKRAWKSANIDDLARYYTMPVKSSRGTPTVNDFIFYYAKKLSEDFSQDQNS